MLELAKKSLFLTVGWSFIIPGIIGLFLPFLQGILFIFVGLVILSRQSQIARSFLSRLKDKYPDQYESLTSLRKRFSSQLQRWITR